MCSAAIPHVHVVRSTIGLLSDSYTLLVISYACAAVSDLQTFIYCRPMVRVYSSLLEASDGCRFWNDRWKETSVPIVYMPKDLASCRVKTTDRYRVVDNVFRMLSEPQVYSEAT